MRAPPADVAFILHYAVPVVAQIYKAKLHILMHLRLVVLEEEPA